jgi:hypothetical protein
MLSALAIFVVATGLAALGQQTNFPRPTQGFGVGDPLYQWNITLPSSIAQCEPFVIYYNTSIFDEGDNFILDIRTPDSQTVLVLLEFPNAIGYLDWICNIPAGYSFVAEAFSFKQYYTVDPGSSSACLGNVTTTNSILFYQTPYFKSYTQAPPTSDASQSEFAQQCVYLVCFWFSRCSIFVRPPITYPTKSYSTITVGCDLFPLSCMKRAHFSYSSTYLFVAPTSSLPSSTPSSSPTPPATSSHKSTKAAIAGGVVGGIAFILLLLTLAFFFLQRRRNSRFGSEARPFTTRFEPAVHITSQIGPTSVSTPLSGAFSASSSHSCAYSTLELAHVSHVDPIDGEPVLDISSTSALGDSVPVIPLSGKNISHFLHFDSDTRCRCRTITCNTVFSKHHPKKFILGFHFVPYSSNFTIPPISASDDRVQECTI